MKIYLTRHAQKDSEIKDTIQDHYNRLLTGKGALQAEELGKYMQQKNIDAIYSSNMPRAKQTTEIANKFISCNKIFYSDQLDEIEHCKLPNHPQRSLFKKLMQEDWNYEPPFGESCLSGKNRVEKYFYDVILKKPYSAILIITHGRLLRLLLSDYFPNPHDILNNRYYSVGVSEMDYNLGLDKPVLVKYNSIDYLPSDLKET